MLEFTGNPRRAIARHGTRDIVLATAIISIVLNPLAFGVSRRLEPHVEALNRRLRDGAASARWSRQRSRRRACASS